MATDNVVILPVETTLDLPPERIINALVNDMDDIQMIIAVTRNSDGELDVYTSSSDKAEIVYYLYKTMVKMTMDY